MKKIRIRNMAIVFLITLMLVACGKASEEKGSVYYLNFKPEVSEVWEEIAQIYGEETGVEVKVLTAASGTYEKVLQSELAKREAPTLFQINGPIGYENWKEFCYNLQETELYSHLLDKDLAVSTENGVYGIPYVVEGYGIIYNAEIMNKYFSLQNKAVNISSTEEITSFEMLKKVVEDMTKKKSELGIKGVFASTSMATGEDWRWTTHLMNLPIYYEFLDNGVSDMKEIDFKYADNFKNIFDLYVENSSVPKTMIGSKTVNDSMKEFALGEVAMVQNGNWAWSQISTIEGNVVKEENVKFLPIYVGTADETTQGLCIGTENYFSVNSWSTEEDIKATIDFINWLFTSDVGKDYVSNKLGFISPFDTFADDEIPNDPLAAQVVEAMSEENLSSVAWNFTAFPGQLFKDQFGKNLLYYVEDSITWNEVVQSVKQQWKEGK